MSKIGQKVKVQATILSHESTLTTNQSYSELDKHEDIKVTINFEPLTPTV